MPVICDDDELRPMAFRDVFRSAQVARSEFLRSRMRSVKRAVFAALKWVLRAPTHRQPAELLRLMRH